MDSSSARLSTFTFGVDRVPPVSTLPERLDMWRDWDVSPLFYTYTVSYNDDLRVGNYRMVSLQYSDTDPRVIYLYYPAVTRSLILGYNGYFSYENDKQNILHDIRIKNYQFLMSTRKKVNKSISDTFALSIEPSSEAPRSAWHSIPTGFPRVFIIYGSSSDYLTIGESRRRRLNPPEVRLHVWFGRYPKITYGIIVTHQIKTDFPGLGGRSYNWRAYLKPQFVEQRDDRVVIKVINYNFEYLKKLSKVTVGNKYLLGGIEF